MACANQDGIISVDVNNPNNANLIYNFITGRSEISVCLEDESSIDDFDIRKSITTKFKEENEYNEYINALPEHNVIKELQQILDILQNKVERLTDEDNDRIMKNKLIRKYKNLRSEIGKVIDSGWLFSGGISFFKVILSEYQDIELLEQYELEEYELIALKRQIEEIKQTITSKCSTLEQLEQNLDSIMENTDNNEIANTSSSVDLFGNACVLPPQNTAPRPTEFSQNPYNSNMSSMWRVRQEIENIKTEIENMNAEIDNIKQAAERIIKAKNAAFLFESSEPAVTETRQQSTSDA